VVVLSGDLGDELASVLAALAQVRAEVVGVDGVGPSAATGHETANTVLELAVGQDFVFTLPRLSTPSSTPCSGSSPMMRPTGRRTASSSSDRRPRRRRPPVPRLRR
jgi:hypothetical protein